MRIKITVCLALLQLSILLLSPVPLTAGPITLTEVGNPSWEPVDLHLFAAVIGTGPDYTEFFQILPGLLPPPNHHPHPDLTVGPGAPHAGPYDQELANGIANVGYVDSDVFRASEFSNGKGVMLIYMVVPRAGSPMGSSPDFASGPIIPNSLFPIAVTDETFKNGVHFSEPLVDGIVPALDAINPPFLVDGHSHFPDGYVDNFDFALPTQTVITGSYEYRVTLTDTAGNGWIITAPFQVVPEPGTFLLLSAGLAGVAVLRRRSRGVSKQ